MTHIRNKSQDSYYKENYESQPANIKKNLGMQDDSYSFQTNFNIKEGKRHLQTISSSKPIHLSANPFLEFIQRVYQDKLKNSQNDDELQKDSKDNKKILSLVELQERRALFYIFQRCGELLKMLKQTEMQGSTQQIYQRLKRKSEQKQQINIPNQATKAWIRTQYQKNQNLDNIQIAERFDKLKNLPEFFRKMKTQQGKYENKIIVQFQIDQDQDSFINCQSLVSRMSEYEEKQWNQISQLFLKWLCLQYIKFQQNCGFFIPKLELKYIIYNKNTKKFMIDPRAHIYWALGLSQQPMSIIQKITHTTTPTGEVNPIVYYNPFPKNKNQALLQELKRQCQKNKEQLQKNYDIFVKDQTYLQKYSDRRSIQRIYEELKDIQNQKQNTDKKQEKEMQFRKKFNENVALYNYSMLSFKFFYGFQYDLQKLESKIQKLKQIMEQNKTKQNNESLQKREQKGQQNQEKIHKNKIQDAQTRNQRQTVSQLKASVMKKIQQKHQYQYLLIKETINKHLKLQPETKITFNQVKLQFLDIHQNPGQLKKKYQQQIREIRNRCKYYLQLIRNISFPQSSFFLASHNATRYLIIGYLCLLFDIEKDDIFLQNYIEIQNQSLIKQLKTQKMYKINKKNPDEFKLFLKMGGLPYQIKQVIDRIKQFLAKSLQKIQYYQDNPYQLVENHKIVTIKAKAFVNYIRQLDKENSQNHFKFALKKNQIIEALEIYLTDHLFHKRIIKFKEMQMAYQFKGKIQQKKQMEMEKFVVEAIILNFMTLQIFNLSEAYKLKYTNSNQQVFTSTRFFNNIPFKDFEEVKQIVDKNKKFIKNKEITIYSKDIQSCEQLKEFRKILVLKSQIIYQSSGMVYDLKNERGPKIQNFFGKAQISDMQQIIKQGIQTEYLKQKQWKKMILLQTFQKKQIQQNKLEKQYTQSTIDPSISQVSIQQEDKQQTRPQIINNIQYQKEQSQYKNLYAQKLAQKITKLLSRVVSSSSTFLIILHNSVRYLYVMMFSSIFLKAYCQKNKVNKPEKINKVKQYFNKADQRIRQQFEKKTTINSKQADQNKQFINDHLKLIQTLRRFQSIYQKNSNTQSYSEKLNNIADANCLISSLIQISKDYLYRFQGFQNKELQIKHSINKLKDSTSSQKKNLRLIQIKSYLLELFMINYDWIEAVILFYLAQYSKLYKISEQEKSQIDFYLQKIEGIVINTTIQLKELKKQNFKDEQINKIFQDIKQLQKKDSSFFQFFKTFLKKIDQKNIQIFKNQQKQLSCISTWCGLMLQKLQKNKKASGQKSNFFGFNCYKNVCSTFSKKNRQLIYPQWGEILYKQNYSLSEQESPQKESKNFKKIK